MLFEGRDKAARSGQLRPAYRITQLLPRGLGRPHPAVSVRRTNFALECLIAPSARFTSRTGYIPILTTGATLLVTATALAIAEWAAVRGVISASVRAALVEVREQAVRAGEVSLVATRREIYVGTVETLDDIADRQPELHVRRRRIQ